MRILFRSKDGGKESRVWGYWLIEWKRFFSIGLLCFEDGSRDAYHSHAFNCISWVLWGQLGEQLKDYPDSTWFYYPSFRPVRTYRDTFHKVTSIGRTWVLTFRGPWAETWKEYLPTQNRELTLTSGRIEI